jgi:ABC-2 type transport system ATP-binding protein
VERVADWIAILHQGKLQIAAPLEDIKASVSMLSISMKDPLLMLPSEMHSLEVLHATQNGRTIQLMVRGLQDETLRAIHADANLFEVKAVRPNLEELYIGFTQPMQGDLASLDRTKFSKAM